MTIALRSGGETVILTPEEREPLNVTLTVLKDHIERLKGSLAKAEGELEGSRGRAAQLAGLEAQGEALQTAAKLLRAQADEVRMDRDYWRERAAACPAPVAATAGAGAHRSPLVAAAQARSRLSAPCVQSAEMGGAPAAI